MVQVLWQPLKKLNNAVNAGICQADVQLVLDLPKAELGVLHGELRIVAEAAKTREDIKGVFVRSNLRSQPVHPA